MKTLASISKSLKHENRHSSQHKTTLLWIIAPLLLGYSLLTILPWRPFVHGSSLDPSWASALHVAFREGIKFGNEFIYTYGPYGFLRTPDNLFLETHSYAVGFCLLIALATWAGLMQVIRYCLGRRDGSIWFLLPIVFFFPDFGATMDSLQFSLIILPLILYFYVSKRLNPVLILTIINASLASLTKHTYLMLCIFFVALIAIDEVGKLRRLPLVALVYFFFTWLFWIIAGQDVSLIPAYLINGSDIVSGFSATMGSAGHLDEILLYCFGTGIFLLIVGASEWKNRRWWGMLPSLGLAAIMFITFKGAFTRHDGHALQAFFNTTPTMLIFTAMLWSSLRRNSWHLGRIKASATFCLGTVALIIVILGSIVINHYLGFGYGAYASKFVQHNLGKIPDAISVIQGKQDLEAIVESGKAKVRISHPLSPVSGTVDLYPNEIGTIFAHDLDYQPRPIIQSFSAYTGKLAQLNRQHLQQPDAPDNIFFDISPIDGRMGSFEDGLSWPEILTRYDLADINGRYLLWQKASQPREYQLQPLSKQVDIALNEWYEIPNAQAPVWSKIDVHPNLLGKLASAFLRLPALDLEIETASGVKTKYRTVGGVMQEGFLLSPVLSNRWDFLDLATPSWQKKLEGKQVKKFRIISQGFNSWIYPPTYKVDLSGLKFPRPEFTEVKGWTTWNNYSTPKPINGSLRRVEIDDLHKMGWDAHAPMKMLINLPADKSKFSFSFGILDQVIESATPENIGDGVEFKITALQSDGEAQVLFSRQLQPFSNNKDRGLHKASIDLSQIAVRELILETLPQENHNWDWSYWSDLTAE
ncbi:MAG: hypothetical protein AAFQ14_00135 [Cyanobacteria bacterium J06621_12]